MTIGVGLVGLSAAGGWAARAHLPALRGLEDFRVAALSASSAESAQAAGLAQGVDLVFDDPRRMAERPEVDLVVVTVRVPLHLEVVGAALAAGKHVFCEWPLARSAAEAETMRDLAASAGARGFVGLQGRSLPLVRFLVDLIAGGGIGTVLSTTILGSGDLWGPTVRPELSFVLDPAYGATMLRIPVAHALEVVAACLGEPIELAATAAVRRPTVTVEGGGQVVVEVADHVALNGRLAGGAVLSLHYRGGHSPAANLRWEIEGSEATVLVEGTRGNLQLGRLEARIGAAGDRRLRPLPLPGEYELPGFVRGTPPYAVAHAYARLRQDLETGTELAPSFEDGVVRHRMVEAIEASAASGGGERLALAAPRAGKVEVGGLGLQH